MAALAIDVVTLYTARSEAQLAADAGALAGARVLANSGMTSDPTLTAAAESGPFGASLVAQWVATHNNVGGSRLNNAEVTVTFPATAPSSNPQITVQIQVTDLPTFFARIWGNQQLAVSASATAEAYNPSGAGAVGGPPVAPVCVKPWLLPNIDPSNPPRQIFDPATGIIQPTASTLLGWTTPAPPPPNPTRLTLLCPGGDCSGPPTPQVWQYYPGDPASFVPPTKALPSCNPALTTAYEESIAGCIQTPIACNSQVNIDMSIYASRTAETVSAVNCLTHGAANGGDQIDLSGLSPPFQFIAGIDNPVAQPGNDVMVSDSLVTVPVYDSSGGLAPTNPVQIIGFVQLFLSPQGGAVPASGDIETTVVNVAGCGTPGNGGASGQPILGHGASPVAVRLITPP
jgi:hypothetical protein